MREHCVGGFDPPQASFGPKAMKALEIPPGAGTDLEEAAPAAVFGESLQHSVAPEEIVLAREVVNES
jgi:hypothetical protein